MKLQLFAFIVCTFLMVSCSNSQTVQTDADTFETVNLPDGSVAYLNSNSSITFEESFNPRVIQHSGEVFYSVVEGNSPFTVTTDKGDVEVLGTEFNVKSDTENLEVEVEKGSVQLKVNKLIKKIDKGQKAFFSNLKEDIQVAKADLKHKKWVKGLKKGLQNVGEEIKEGSEKVGEKSKKLGEGLKDKLKDIKK